jgi:hypothetical protein
VKQPANRGLGDAVGLLAPSLLFGLECTGFCDVLMQGSHLAKSGVVFQASKASDRTSAGVLGVIGTVAQEQSLGEQRLDACLDVLHLGRALELWVVDDALEMGDCLGRIPSAKCGDSLADVFR